MSQIRVLRVIARMNVGGPALQVTNLVRGLDPEVFEHRVLVGQVEEGEEDYLSLRAPDISVVRVPGLGRSVKATGDLVAFRAIVRELRSFKPDILHTHTAKAGVLGRLAARVARVPYVVHTFHGHLLHGYFSPPVTMGVRLVERVLARGTDRIVSVGSHVRDDLLAAGIGKPGKYVVVPPGVALPPRPTRSEARARLGLAPDVPVVAFVGRLTGVKRPDRLIAVARLLARSHPELVTMVVGEGPSLEETKSRAADLGERVRFLGWRGDVETVYAASDVVLLTSDNEGMPVSLIEASLCGIPCVTTDVGSAGEVVLQGTTGFVVPKEASALAEAVAALLGDDELRARMGKAAARHAEEHFGAARLVEDMARLYRGLVAGER